jgi:hydroxymethylpyrimidine pyrophosphatase-like HAD family hydrolase
VLGRLLFEDALGPAPALRGLALARQHGWHRQAYQDERLLCEEDRPEAYLYAEIAQVPITFVADLEPTLQRGTTKLVCVIEDLDEAARCEALLRDALGDTARVTRSLPQFVEVTDPRASKGAALARLAGELGVGMDEAVAVGDAPNDADMLQAAGYAVAVEGAPESVLAIADAVCPPPAAAGVAAVLERLGLTG